ncbi:MAG: sulfite exporter TauE/SafE family protein [Treponema sp.]|nr:sulfite exporter TauE/SafE family protein [Treponema sp.]
METGTLTKKLYIDGMTCVNCQNRIGQKLRGAPGVEEAEVSYNTGTATVTYNASVITIQEIAAIIEDLGYSVPSGATASGESPGKPQADYRKIGVLILCFSLFVLLQHAGFLGFFNSFPLAEVGMGYGMLFLIGVITSVHCVAMCGGINLSQCIPQAPGADNAAALKPSLLYNLGRVVSYTAAGVLVGALGSAVSFSGVMKGAVQLAAGVFMILMGVNMLGVFPGLRRFNPRMPRIFARKIDSERRKGGPLYIGLLNGLMPCGPLQAMQLYALSTGSPLKGGLSMLIFSLGTVPLMFGLGALSSVLSRKFTKTVMAAGAALVVILGLVMFSNGWNLSGLGSLQDIAGGFSRTPQPAAGSGNRGGTVIENGVQIVNSVLSPGGYPAITVQAGIPVKWTINAPQGSINGCNNQAIIREYGIEIRFRPGDNVVEFTPTKTGTFRYSCWMGMIRSSITVVEPGADSGVPVAQNETKPVPAGVVIPADDLAIAELNSEEGYQVVEINLRDDGIFPAVAVVQRFVPVRWVINNESLDQGNSSLLFPVYVTKVPMTQGENVIQLLPREDFDFSTADNVFYGLIKTVDDIGNFDPAAVRAAATGWETLIYPEEYFDARPGGAGCCR